MSQIRPVSDLRNNFADISHTVHETREPVILTKNGGLGEVHVPSDYQHINGDNNRIDSTGVWQPANYNSSADNLITIDYEGGVGELTLR